MRYYKMTSNGFLVSVGTGGKTGEEISETEYNEILSAIHNAPTAPSGYGYRLTTELEWELYKLPPVEEEEEVTAEDYEAALAEMGVTI